MVIKIVDTLPKCDFRNDYPHPDGDDAIYDAPVIPSGSWANMCKACAFSRGNLRLGTKFQLREEYQGEVPDNTINAIEPDFDEDMEYWADVLENGIREPECPTCGEVRRMEPDACSFKHEDGLVYAFECEGCGTKVKMSAGLC